MWSRNASPIATLTRPRPSIATVAFSWVSLLLRTTSPTLDPLFKSHLQKPHELGGFAVSSRGPRATQVAPPPRARARSILPSPPDAQRRHNSPRHRLGRRPAHSSASPH